MLLEYNTVNMPPVSICLSETDEDMSPIPVEPLELFFALTPTKRKKKNKGRKNIITCDRQTQTPPLRPKRPNSEKTEGRNECATTVITITERESVGINGTSRVTSSLDYEHRNDAAASNVVSRTGSDTSKPTKTLPTNKRLHNVPSFPINKIATRHVPLPSLYHKSSSPVDLADDYGVPLYRKLTSRIVLSRGDTTSDDDADARAAWDSDSAWSWPPGGRWVFTVPPETAIVPPEELLVPHHKLTAAKQTTHAYRRRRSSVANSSTIINNKALDELKEAHKEVKIKRDKGKSTRRRALSETERLAAREFMNAYEKLNKAALAHQSFETSGVTLERLRMLRNPHPPHDNLLKFALTRNNVPVFHLVVKAASDLLDDVDANGNTAAHEAAMRNLVDVLRVIQRSKPYLFNKPNKQKKTPFVIAIEYGKYDAVEFLSQLKDVSWESVAVPGLSVLAEALIALCNAKGTARKAQGFPQKDAVSPMLSPHSIVSSSSLMSTPRKTSPQEAPRHTPLDVFDCLVAHQCKLGGNFNAHALDGSGTLLHLIPLKLEQRRLISPFTFRLPEQTLYAAQALIKLPNIDLHARDRDGQTAFDLAHQFGLRLLATIYQAAV